jgi:hypothetical protein
VKDIQKSGLPHLTVNDIDEAQKYNINNLQMTYGHLNLIAELLAENEAKASDEKAS